GLSVFIAGICAAGSCLAKTSSGVFAACEVGATSRGMMGLIRDPLSVLISDWEVLGFCNGPPAFLMASWEGTMHPDPNNATIHNRPVMRTPRLMEFLLTSF